MGRTMGFPGGGKGDMFQMMQMGMGMMGKGKGKGKDKNPAKRFPPSKKVFIGGLPVLGKEGLSNDLNKKLKEHCGQAGKCNYAEIGMKGTGVACFQTDEEATTAVAMLNGSVFEGNVLQVDVWTRKEPEA